MTDTHHSLIQTAIEGLLQSELGALETGVFVAFDGNKFVDPVGAPWFYVSVMANLDKRANIGDDKEFKALGVVNVTCMVPEGTGKKRVKQMAGSVFTILADRQIPLPEGGKSVTLYGAQYRERGVVNGWECINVLVNYRAFVLLQRA